MRVAVVGGKLQGVEACYLARKAGWHVRLIDGRPDAPARGLCDEFVVKPVEAVDGLEQAFDGIDLILPALEDPKALDALGRFSAAAGLAFAFDPLAHRVSSSKLMSDRLFAELQIPAPLPWPDAGFPILAKPSGGSGSRGIRIIRSADQLRAEFPGGGAAAEWVAQEYLPGPSYSLEVIAAGGGARCFQVTDLFVDAGHDCKRVTAPTELCPRLVAEFERIGLALADAIDLRGLMDVEVILNGGRLKVLEIDARLPSQTPTAVFWSSGENLVQLLGEAACGRELPAPRPFTSMRAVVYEHVQVSPGRLEIGGEHVMAGADILRLHRNFFGADEALTDYAPGRSGWRATLIVTGGTRDEAWRRRCEVLADIRRMFGLDRFVDPEPSVPV